ncbi:hypothetical protein B0A49_13837, partial [Cryomyces minteri]
MPLRLQTTRSKGKRTIRPTAKASALSQALPLSPPNTQQNILVSTRRNTQTTLAFSSPRRVAVTPPTTTIDTPSELPDTLIDAFERVSFPLQGALLHASYRPRPRQKRGIGDNRTSWIWRYGMDIERLSTSLEWKGKFWLCKACHEGGIKRQPLAAESSSNASKHMLKSHGITPTGPPIQQPPTQSLDGWMKKDLPSEAKEEVFRRDLINWIAQADISFMQAASTELHKVIKNG